MRWLILSDIHSNWEALQAVMETADAAGYDRILCCGDVVGYGADPNACTQWTRANCGPIVRGNHDKACAGIEDLEWFNSNARKSALWTQHELTPDNVAWLRNLPQGPMPVDDFQIVHGTPVDEDAYLLQPCEASMLLGYLEKRVSFFGHSHIQGGFHLTAEGVTQIPPVDPWMDRRVCILKPDEYYLINPGSVGQPRDGDPRAAFAFYSEEDRCLTYCRVRYNVPGAKSKIIDAGLPPLLGHRLELGR